MDGWIELYIADECALKTHTMNRGQLWRHILLVSPTGPNILRHGIENKYASSKPLRPQFTTFY